MVAEGIFLDVNIIQIFWYHFSKPPMDDLTPEERDQRTVFCMQLSQRIRGRDLEEFFSSVGKVRDVKLITCNKTRRFKGIAYVEFKDPESVPLVGSPLLRFAMKESLHG